MRRNNGRRPQIARRSRRRARGETGLQHLVLLLTVGLLAVASFQVLGSSQTTALVGRTTSESATSTHGVPSVTSRAQAGVLGALNRLAEVTQLRPVIDAATAAVRDGNTVDLNGAAAAVFGEGRTTKSTVKAWRKLLTEAEEGHAVMATQFGSASATVLEPDQLGRLLTHAIETDLGFPFLYEQIDVPFVQNALNRIMEPFDGGKRLTLLQSLLDIERPVHFAAVDEFARRGDGSADQFARLAEYDDWGVRDAVAANPALPRDLLNTMASDEEGFVRRTIVTRPDVTEAALTKLSKDSDGFVRETALRRLAENDYDAPVTKGDTIKLEGPNPLNLPERELALMPRVEKVINALDDGVEFEPRRAKTWLDLPALEIVGNRLAVHPDGRRIHGQTFEADGITWKVRLLRSSGDFAETNACMGPGNCARPGSNYEKMVGQGTAIMANVAPAASPKDIQYLLYYRRSGNGWQKGQYGSKLRNQAVTSQQLNAAFDQLLVQLNGQ